MNLQKNLEISKKTKKKKEKNEGHMVHAVPPKYMGFMYMHAREQVATTDGQDMIRDIINHLSHVGVCVCVCVMLEGGNLGWLTSDGLTG